MHNVINKRLGYNASHYFPYKFTVILFGNIQVCRLKSAVCRLILECNMGTGGFAILTQL